MSQFLLLLLQFLYLLPHNADAAALQAQWPLQFLEPIPGTSPLSRNNETTLGAMFNKLLLKRGRCQFGSGGHYCETDYCCSKWMPGADQDWAEGGFCCQGTARGGGCCGNGCCALGYWCAWADA